MKWQKGYTLIEILVGLTIIGFLFSFGYVSFRDFSRRQAVAGQAKSIQGDLRLAQETALAGQKPDDPLCNPPAVLNSYGFRVTTPTQYRIEANCSDVIDSYEIIVKEVNLSPDLALSTSSVNPIEFKVLGQGNNITAGTGVTLTLTQVATSNQTTITITSGGEIK